MFNAMYERKLTLGEMFSLAGDLLKNHWKRIVLTSTILYAIYVAIDFVTALFFPLESNPLMYLIGSTLNLIFGIAASLILIILIGRLVNEQEPNPREMLDTLGKNLLPALLVSLMAGFIIIVALIFFLIPGIVVFTYYMFVLYALVFREKKGYDALEYSWNVVKGDWWKVFGLFLIQSVISYSISYLCRRLGAGNLIIIFPGEVGGRVIESLFLTVNVIMFFNFDTLKHKIPPLPADDEEPILT